MVGESKSVEAKKQQIKKLTERDFSNFNCVFSPFSKIIVLLQF